MVFFKLFPTGVQPLNMVTKNRNTVRPVLRGHDLWEKEKSGLLRQVTS
jgi:hypothetical protein